MAPSSARHAPSLPWKAASATTPGFHHARTTSAAVHSGTRRGAELLAPRPVSCSAFHGPPGRRTTKMASSACRSSTRGRWHPRGAVGAAGAAARCAPTTRQADAHHGGGARGHHASVRLLEASIFPYRLPSKIVYWDRLLVDNARSHCSFVKSPRFILYGILRKVEFANRP